MQNHYTETEIIPRLVFFPEWKYEEGALVREYSFKDFKEAFAFMTVLAMIAEKADHHPDIYNSYNKVKVSLTTHSAGGVTDKDFAFIEKING